MLSSLSHLHVVPIIVVAIVGFLFGAVWYMALFGKALAAEMKRTPEEGEKAKGAMAPNLVKGFLWMLVSTFALWVLVDSHHSLGYRRGAALGFVVGALVVGVRMLDHNVWEKKSFKQMAINVGHEVLLFVIQGAIFGHWR